MTLVETLVSMALSVAVSGAVLSLVTAGQTVARTQPETADLQQRDARGELEHHGLARLDNGGEERDDPAAVPHPIRGVAACDAAARLLVPARRLEALTGLIEMMRKQRGVGRIHRLVDGQQGSRDRRVGFAPAVHELCAVGDLLRERVREGGEVLQSIPHDLFGFSCALGGSDGRTLFMVAAEWHGPEQIGQGPRTGVVYTERVEVPGIAR